MKKLSMILILTVALFGCEKQYGHDQSPANCYDIFKSRVVDIRADLSTGKLNDWQYDSIYLAEAEAMYRCQLGE